MNIAVKILSLLSTLIILVSIAALIPPDMDIFIQFQPLACWYHPDNLGGCHHWDLTVAGFLHWPRSADFQGLGVYSFLYYPIFLLFPYWQSGVGFNLIWVVGIVWLFIRLTGCNPWIATLIFGANFFYDYNLLHDYQVGYHTLMLFGVTWMATHILIETSPRKLAVWNIALGIAVFLGIEYKAVFVFYLPASALLAARLNMHRMPTRALMQALALKCLPAMLLSSGCYLLIVFARLPNGSHYLTMLQAMQAHYKTFSELVPYLEHLQRLIVVYLLSFPDSAWLTYSYAGLEYLRTPLNTTGALITLPFWLLTLWAHLMFYAYLPPVENRAEYDHRRGWVSAFAIAAVLTLLLIASNTKTRDSFHLLPAMICYLGSTALCIDYLYRQRQVNLLWFGSMLAASQLYCTYYVVTQPPTINHSWDRLAAVTYAGQPTIAEHAIIHNLNWGTYFISSLYGPKELIVTNSNDIRDSHSLQKYANFAHAHDRYMVFIGRNAAYPPDWVRAVLPTTVKLFPANGVASQWAVWGEAGL